MEYSQYKMGINYDIMIIWMILNSISEKVDPLKKTQVDISTCFKFLKMQRQPHKTVNVGMGQRLKWGQSRNSIGAQNKLGTYGHAHLIFSVVMISACKTQQTVNFKCMLFVTDLSKAKRIKIGRCSIQL